MRAQFRQRGDSESRMINTLERAQKFKGRLALPLEFLGPLEYEIGQWRFPPIVYLGVLQSGMKQGETVMIGITLGPPPVVGRDSKPTFTKRQLLPDESMSCDTQLTHTRLIHRRRSVYHCSLLDRRFHTRGGDPLNVKSE